ncbi:hypothetical protein [Paenibacillus sp.]|jgi:hypothetical protein|uniref:hypothetical protein n=1 Tax=Paenibacillus sp. TaxID=58172 RepID=UPI00282DA750|nr:hypothetical protein [Paenibacillus sp.]MDR0266949.1 hypothetical protein [Paenibacillus sp.]
MKQTLNGIPDKWKWSGILVIGGLLIGAGVSDCLIAIKHLDLNQIARGLTIFGAGLTILVILDNSKTQKDTEKIQKETILRLEKVEDKLNEIHQSQQLTEEQLREIKELLHKSNS